MRGCSALSCFQEIRYISLLSYIFTRSGFPMIIRRLLFIFGVSDHHLRTIILFYDVTDYMTTVSFMMVHQQKGYLCSSLNIFHYVLSKTYSHFHIRC